MTITNATNKRDPTEECGNATTNQKDDGNTEITITSFSPYDLARGWKEVSLLHQDPSSNDKSATSTLGERILKGHSVVLLTPRDSFVTTAERTALVTSALALADTTEPTDFETLGRRRLPTQAAANRAAASGTPCGIALPDDADDLVETIYRRIATFLDTTWPHDVVQVMFGDATPHDHDDDPPPSQDKAPISLAQLMEMDELQYASREPAVNVYRAGGAFDAHADDQTLTVLMCVSTPDVDFQNGGTVFWPPTRKRPAAPRVVVRPPAGTVLLFGGTVLHAAQAVTTGCRVMVVSSFGRKDPDQDESTYLY